MGLEMRMKDEVWFLPIIPLFHHSRLFLNILCP
jgi:hypothetical protein